MLSPESKYKAVYDSKGARWRIYDSKSKSIGSRKSRDYAKDDLAALELGSHKSQTKGAGAGGAAGRQSDRLGAAPTVAYAEPTRDGNYVGRGNKRPQPYEPRLQPVSPTKRAQVLLDRDCTDPVKLVTFRAVSRQRLVRFGVREVQVCIGDG